MFGVLLYCDSLLVLIIMNDVFWTHSTTHIAKGADVQLIKMCNCTHLALFLAERVVLALLDSYILYWSNWTSSFFNAQMCWQLETPKSISQQAGRKPKYITKLSIANAKIWGEISLFSQFCKKQKNHRFVTLANFQVRTNFPYHKTVEKTKI